MIGLGAPWWLIALAAIPLLRWLHRWQAPLSTAPVSAAFLWDSAESLSAGGENRQRPDPAWRRRALIAALLALALAQPWWQRDSGLITVWIDDSLSMSATEQGESRLVTGLAELRRALQESGAGRVTLRSLSDPARTMLDRDPDAFDAGEWLAASQGEPDPPAAALLSRDSAHWLVTDGANEQLVEWAVSAPLQRIIRVGVATENVAVTRIAARRNLDSAGSFDLLIDVSNQGSDSANRELQLASATGDFYTRMLALRAGETRHLTATHAVGENELTASLSPADAVALDDSLTLSLAEIARIPVALDVLCPAPLALAIRAHPTLLVVPAGETAELQLNCSDRVPLAPAVLRFHTAATAPVDVSLEWWPGAGRLQELQLRQDWMAAAAWNVEPEGEYETLLAANQRPLLIRRPSRPTVLETVLDMSRPEFVRQPEYAALIAGLIDLALGRTLLDAVAIATIDPGASDIVPSEVVASEGTQLRHGAIRQPLSDLLLALAALVLLADMLLLWRAAREARRA